MNRIFIDVGANVGSTIDYFNDRSGPFDKIYAFEPNYRHHHIYEMSPDDNVTLIKEPVWDHDGEIEFYIHNCREARPERMSNSGLHKLVDKEPLEVVKTPCLDFSKWLLNNLKSEDYNILKMDIEGAEFKVLNHALDHGGLELLDELYVEHHKNRFGESRTGQPIRSSGQAKYRWGHQGLRKRLTKLDNLQVLKFDKWIEESEQEWREHRRIKENE